MEGAPLHCSRRPRTRHGPWGPLIHHGCPRPRIYHGRLYSLPRFLKPNVLSLPLVSPFPLGPSLGQGSLLRPGGRLSRLPRPGGRLSRLLRPGGCLSRLLLPGGRLSRLLRPGGHLICQSPSTSPSTCQSPSTSPSTCQSPSTSPSTCQSPSTSPSTCQSPSTSPSTCQSPSTSPSTCQSPSTSPSTCQSPSTSPSTCQSHSTSPSTCQSHSTSPSTCQSHPTSPPTCQSHLTPPPTCQSHLTPPPTCQSHLRRPARVTSRHSGLPSIPSRPCCLIVPTWTWPSIPSPGFTSAPPPSWIVPCVWSVWKPLFGGGLCHESGCHSLQLHITHGLHLPSCTAHTHSRPPLHQSHSCHHSLINPDCLTTPAPHSLTHIKAAHKHSPSAKSCFPLANILSVSLVFWFPVFTWTAYLLWPFAACPFDPACLLISSLSAACPDLALSLLLILSSLHNSCYYLWPLPVWPPLVNH